MPKVVLERVSKTYPGGVSALLDLNLEVEEGHRLVLVGPSGCGKTTTLRLIAGLEQPTRGVIRFNGHVVNAQPPSRRNVALVFQRPALYPHRNVADNLAFGLDLQSGWMSRWRPRWRVERQRRIQAAAESLKLTEVLHRRPQQLSGGQQQRVALGRALVRQAEVLLLDEPLSHLDAPLRLEMRRQLPLLLSRFPATILYVTHDQEEALALGDQVGVLHQGRVEQVGTPTDLLYRPRTRFVAGFLGWPPINLLDGRLVLQKDRVSFQGAGGVLVVPEDCQGPWQHWLGQPVTLGIRPERVHLGPDGSTPAETDLEMGVRLVERMGSVCLVTLVRGDWTLTAKVVSSYPPQERTSCRVVLSLTEAHLFDPVTGRALAHGAVLVSS
jgi:multiple sugar transport system ATP-binding protein